MTFRRVLDKRPDFGAAKFNLGLALSHQGQLSESEQLYSELIDHKQHLTAAHWVELRFAPRTVIFPEFKQTLRRLWKQIHRIAAA